MDVGLALQRQRAHLEPRVAAVGQVLRGVRLACEGLGVCAEKELGRHWIR